MIRFFMCLTVLVMFSGVVTPKPIKSMKSAEKVAGKKSCFSMDEYLGGSADYTFTSENGYLNMDGDRFNLKGTSWFGFETSLYVFHGLWAQDYHFFIDFMANYSFNALRLPFSAYLALNDPTPSGINSYQMNEDLVGLSALEVMDVIIDAMGDAGIVIMLDMHSLEPDGYMQDGLWYDDSYSTDDNKKAWKVMIDRYKDTWNVIAMDVFNEPFDGTWDNNANNADTDWPSWCQTIGNLAHSNGADWLVFCEGVANSPSCSDACFWGEDLQGVRNKTADLDVANKLVYSPHVYGPSVASQKYFDASNFPDNMPAIWDQHFGFIRSLNGYATVTGEWGGYMTGTDETWMNRIGQYFVEIDIPDNFFWCLNSDSGDTGGLLDGWSTPSTDRLSLTAVVQPNPTKISKTDDTVCFEF